MKYIVVISIKGDEIDTWLNYYEAVDEAEALYKWFSDKDGYLDDEYRQEIKVAYEKETTEVFNPKDTDVLREALQIYYEDPCTIVVALLTEDSVKQILELQSYCLSSQIDA
jgi:hypothetical protein